MCLMVIEVGFGHVSKSSGSFNQKQTNFVVKSCTERLWVEQYFKVLKVPMIPKNLKLMEVKVYIQVNLNFFYHKIVLTA